MARSTGYFPMALVEKWSAEEIKVSASDSVWICYFALNDENVRVSLRLIYTSRSGNSYSHSLFYVGDFQAIFACRT